MKANLASCGPSRRVLPSASAVHNRSRRGFFALGLSVTSALSAEAVSKETLEQRVIETARVIEKHRHYKNNVTRAGGKGRRVRHRQYSVRDQP